MLTQFDPKTHDMFKLLTTGENVLRRALVVLGMCIAIVVFLIIVFHSPVSHVRNGKAQPDGAMAAFDPPFFNFGDIMQMETIRHEFTLRNLSDHELHILGLRSSCNCTVIRSQDSTNIAPKSFIRVPVEFESRTAQGDVGSTVEALVEIDGKKYYAAATIGGWVNADFAVDPPLLDFGKVFPGRGVTRTIKVVPGALKQFSLTDIHSTSSDFAVSLHTNQTANSSETHLELVVTFNAPSIDYSQIFDGRVEAKSSSQRMPALSVPVHALVQPDLEIIPATVVFPNRAITGTSRFTIKTAAPSKLTRISITTGNGIEDLPAAATNTTVNADWESVHVLQLANSPLAKAQRINFELEVRNDTGRTEARSVSSQIKRL